MMTKKIPSWMGPIVEGSDEEKVLAQIRHNSDYWKSDICKQMTVEKYCAAKGVLNPKAIINDLVNQGILKVPKSGYIAISK